MRFYWPLQYMAFVAFIVLSGLFKLILFRAAGISM